MKKIILLVFLSLVFLQTYFAQENTFFQTGHTHDILEVRFSPDDSQLVSYSAGDGRFCLWEVKTGRLLWMTKTSFIRKGNESINLKEFYWSEDGGFLVTKSANGTFQTWDVKTGKIQALTDSKPDIKLIVPSKKSVSYTKDYDNISIVDEETKEIRQIKRFGFNPRFDFSNEGKLLAEAGGWGDASIRITEIKTGKFWWLDGHPSVIGGLVFSPDGKFLAVGGSDKIIYVFDVTKQSVSAKLYGNTKPINSLAFSPDGKFLVSSEKFGIMRVWDWKNQNLLREIKPEKWLGQTQVVFSPDGKIFAVANDSSGFDFWETQSWKLIRKFCLDEDTDYECGSKAISISFSKDGKRIFGGYEDGTIKIWDLRQEKPLKIIKYGREIHLATVDNGTKILAASNQEDKPIKLFDANTGTEIRKYSDSDLDGYIENLALSSDEKYFVTSDIGGDILLWDLNKSSPIREFDIGFSGDDAIAFSPDGKTFAVGGRNQNLFLFDVVSGEKLWQLISSYQPSELETKLEAEKDNRQAVLNEAKANRDKQAATDTEIYKKQVFIKFSHYGDMSDAGEKRMLESDEPKESKVKKSRKDANAAWLRLYNNSPLPINIPTQSMYPPNAKCFFAFPNGMKINGLCDNREISIWHGLEDKNGKGIPFGFDFGSSAILLPKTSVLFPVPLAVLKDGNSIVFSYTFQSENETDKIDNYGTAKELRFSANDLGK